MMEKRIIQKTVCIFLYPIHPRKGNAQFIKLYAIFTNRKTSISQAPQNKNMGDAKPDIIFQIFLFFIFFILFSHKEKIF